MPPIIANDRPFLAIFIIISYLYIVFNSIKTGIELMIFIKSLKDGYFYI